MISPLQRKSAQAVKIGGKEEKMGLIELEERRKEGDAHHIG